MGESPHRIILALTLPVSPLIRPCRSYDLYWYRSRPAVRWLPPDGKRYWRHTEGRVAHFHCIGPALTKTTLIPKAVRCKLLTVVPPRRLRHSHVGVYVNAHSALQSAVSAPSPVHLSYRVTLRTMLQGSVTSCWHQHQKAPKGPKEHKYSLKSAPKWCFYLCLCNQCWKFVHVFYIESTINDPVHHPVVLNLQTWPPQLYLQLHFTAKSRKTGIYPIIIRKPCFAKFLC